MKNIEEAYSKEYAKLREKNSRLPVRLAGRASECIQIRFASHSYKTNIPWRDAIKFYKGGSFWLDSTIQDYLEALAEGYEHIQYAERTSWHPEGYLFGGKKGVPVWNWQDVEFTC